MYCKIEVSEFSIPFFIEFLMLRDDEGSKRTNDEEIYIDDVNPHATVS